MKQPRNESEGEEASVVSGPDQWIAIGIPDGRRAELVGSLKAEELRSYEGDLIPFNMLNLVLQASELARTSNSTLRVLFAGISRLVKRFGTDRVEQIFLGKPTIEESAHVHNLLRMESLRHDVVSAIAEVLGLDNMADDGNGTHSFFLSTNEMAQDEELRRRILDTIENISAKRDTSMNLFGLETFVREGLRLALPGSKRPTSPTEPAFEQEMLYILTEIALLKEIITVRKGVFNCHEGNDTVRLGVTAEPRSIREILREVGGATLSLPMDQWRIHPQLDGYGFFRKEGGQSSTGRARHCDPYYLKQEHLSGHGQREFMLDREGESDSQPRQISLPPLRVPALPWVHGWVTRYMGDSSTGGFDAKGQVADVLTSSVHPVVVRFVRYGYEHRGIGVRMAGEFDEKGSKNLQQWCEEKDQPNSSNKTLLPMGFEVSKMNDLVRVVCNDVWEALARIRVRRRRTNGKEDGVQLP